MNKWFGIGRLTRDSELIYTPSGVAITTFTLAVDRRFKNAQGEKETDFITIKTFKQLAELCAKYLDKGKQCAVSGELQIRTYNDKDGQKRWVTEIVADEVQFLSPKDSNATPPSQQSQQQAQLQYSSQQYPSQQPTSQPQQQQYQQPPQQYGYNTGYPPGSMPPPPGYQAPPTGYQAPPPGYPPQQPQGQPQYGQPTQQSTQQQMQFNANQLGREVNLGDDIPF